MATNGKKKPYYVVDTEKKIITLDMSVKPSADEKEYAAFLIECGYKPRKKSAEKAKQMEDRAKKLLSKEDIQKALANDAENLAKFKAICKVKDATESYNGKNGFFAARSWYMNEVKKEEKKKK